MPECVFCKLIKNGGMSRDAAYEDKDIIAFSDISPKYKVHILIVPKKHIVSVLEASPKNDEILGKILRIGGKIAKEKGLSDKGFRLLTNTGKNAGQSVQHLHVHLLGGEKLRPL
jgi:histidine triad (HIT) family protein